MTDRGKALQRAVLVLTAIAALLALQGCGDSGEDGADKLAKQEELRVAREEAARDARQSLKIAELERRLKRANKDTVAQGAEAGAGPERAPSPTPVDTEEPLVGLWKGEAVIEYDSGESDPFNQTVEIDGLTLGAVAGYSEARQGSTTCHGPITYQGVSEGWYRFTAEERNVAECIDYSEVQLMPDASGALLYRETTDVSVSSGSLERIR